MEKKLNFFSKFLLFIVRVLSFSRIEVFIYYNCVQTKDWYQIELLVLYNKSWNHLTVCKQRIDIRIISAV